MRKTVIRDKCKLDLIIWDTAGSERFQAINRAYYKGAIGALICFDISVRVKKENILKWMKEVKDYANNNCCVAIVGNKVDKVPFPEENPSSFILRDFAHANNYLYIETSALWPDTVIKAFTEIIDDIKSIHLDRLIQDPYSSKVSFIESTEGFSPSQNSLKDAKATTIDSHEIKKSGRETGVTDKEKITLSFSEGNIDENKLCSCS